MNEWVPQRTCAPNWLLKCTVPLHTARIRRSAPMALSPSTTSCCPRTRGYVARARATWPRGSTPGFRWSTTAADPSHCDRGAPEPGRPCRVSAHPCRFPGGVSIPDACPGLPPPYWQAGHSDPGPEGAAAEAHTPRGVGTPPQLWASDDVPAPAGRPGRGKRSNLQSGQPLPGSDHGHRVPVAGAAAEALDRAGHADRGDDPPGTVADRR